MSEFYNFDFTTWGQNIKYGQQQATKQDWTGRPKTSKTFGLFSALSHPATKCLCCDQYHDQIDRKYYTDCSPRNTEESDISANNQFVISYYIYIKK